MTNNPKDLFQEIGRQAGLKITEHDGRPAFGFTLFDLKQLDYDTDEASVEQWVYDTFALWTEWLEDGGRFDFDTELEVEIAGWENQDFKVVLVQPESDTTITHEYQGHMIKPRHGGGYVVTPVDQPLVNAMPGATWFESVEDAKDGIAALIIAQAITPDTGGWGPVFWSLLRLARRR